MRRGSDRICYLHFGPHKTGSTSIQAMLRRRAKDLGRIGIHVATTASSVERDHKWRQYAASAPESSRIRRIFPRAAAMMGQAASLLPWPLPWMAGNDSVERDNHSHLGVRSNFDGHRRLDDSPDWKILSDDIAKHSGCVVISGENIFRRIQNPEHYDQIVEFFLGRGFRLTFIGYVRDQVGWINSHYAQHLKTFRSAIGFRRYVEQALQGRAFEFDAMFANLLSDARVDFQVVSFETAIGKGLERDFLDRVGGSAVAHAPRRVANANFGAKGAYVARTILKDHDGELDAVKGLRKALDNRLRNVAISRGWTQDPYMGFDEDGAQEIREHFRAGNDDFAWRFFGRPWNEIAPPQSVSRSTFNMKSATDEDRCEVEDLVEELRGMISIQIAEL